MTHNIAHDASHIVYKHTTLVAATAGVGAEVGIGAPVEAGKEVGVELQMERCLLKIGCVQG